MVGDDGKATFPVSIDQLPSTTRLVDAKVTVRMRETGGRAVERSLDIGIRPQGHMIGIRPDFDDDEVPQGGTAKFSLIAVDPDGKRKALPGAQWSLVKVERNYQWYRTNNSWNYEPVDLHQVGRQRPGRHQRRWRGDRVAAGRLGPLPARDRDRRSRGPGDQL